MFRMSVAGCIVICLVIAVACLSDSASQRQKVVFTSGRNGSADIFLMDPDGNRQDPLISWNGNEWNPRPLGTSDRLAFFSDSLGGNTIFSLDLITGAIRQHLTIDHEDPFFSVSADGQWIAYHQISERNNVDIYVSRIDGSQRRRITRHPGKDLKPSFSPDGQFLTFTSYREGNSDIYLCRLDSSAMRNITNHPADDANSVFSPDGTRLLFRSGREGSGNQEIYVIGVDGKNLDRLTFHPKWELVASWAADGETIYLGSNRDGRWDIYSTRIGSRDVRRLTNSAGFDGDPVELLVSFDIDGR